LNFSGGTLQRECTDHFLFFNEGQLQRALKEYQTYYNRSRPHQGIDQRIPDLPENRASRLHGSEGNMVFSKPFLEGLHHDYFRAAAKYIIFIVSPSSNLARAIGDGTFPPMSPSTEKQAAYSGGLHR
jgi:hypothetical protein